MRTHPRHRTWIGMAWLLGLASAGSAQDVGPQPADLNGLTHQMAEEVRRLGEDIRTDLGATTEGQNLIADTRELAQAVDEFRGSLRDQPDRFRQRQAYTGISGTWGHLRARLMRQGIRTRATEVVALRIDRIHAQILRGLGLRSLPPEYYGEGPAPSGILETRRLAHALDDRAQYLASAVRADMIAAPNGKLMLQRATDLARACDEYHVAVDQLDRPDLAQNLFAPAAAVADNMEREMSAPGIPPRVQTAWQAFASTELLIRQHLGLPTPPPVVRVNLIAPGGGPSPVVALAETLLGQVDAFIDAFRTTAGNVPEGEQFLADARRLRAATADFLRAAGRNPNPSELAYEFRGVDAVWQRFARRINRVARGRTGPNIEQALRMGETIDQIHRLLGMPGFVPVLGPSNR